MKPQKNNSKHNLFSRQVKRIDTEENQEEEPNSCSY